MLLYFHPNYLNTPRHVYDDQQQLRWKWDQAEPFGVSVPDENPASLGAFEMSLRFPGQYADKETNLNYNMARDMDPAIGRYAQSDPIGLNSGLNTYAYVRGNPIKFSDPQGLVEVDPSGFFSGGAGGGGGGTGPYLQNWISPGQQATNTLTTEDLLAGGGILVGSYAIGVVTNFAVVEVGVAACGVARVLPKIAEACKNPILALALGTSICGATTGEVAGRKMGSARSYPRDRETVEKIREASDQTRRINAGQVGR